MNLFNKIFMDEIIYNKFFRQSNKMIVNIPEPYKYKYFGIKACHTPIKKISIDPVNTRSHKSFVKDRQKVEMMLDMNKKYEQELINNQFFKLREMEKYSPRKLNKIQPDKDKSFQNLSPIKLNKSSNSKQKNISKKKNHESLKTLQVQQNFTLFGQKFTQKKIIQNESSLLQIPESQISISKTVQDSWLASPNDPLLGYWIPQNKLVSLFPVNNRKIDKVPVINQPYILPMLGSLTIKSSERKTQKFIVTQLYQKNSLRDVLNEFQNLDQSTIKNYLRKIILCVWNLHKNRISHNRLTIDSFICTQNGEVLLNMLKSSTKPLTENQRYRQSYNFPPQMLLSRTNYDSMKNDIWGIGCIALELITNYEHKNNAYHPYNRMLETDIKDQLDSPGKQSTVQIQRNDRKYKARFITSFQTSRVSNQFNLMKDSMNILQKVKRLIQTDSPTISNQSLICIDLCQSIVLKQISPLAEDFIKKCLHLKLQKRPSIDQLMFHSFLK